MDWKPIRLILDQMEECRSVAALSIWAAKLNQAEIVRQLGISRMTVIHWTAQLEVGGVRRLRCGRGGG